LDAVPRGRDEDMRCKRFKGVEWTTKSCLDAGEIQEIYHGNGGRAWESNLNTYIMY